MDRITKSLLEEFISENGLQNLPQDIAFEHFSGFLATSNHYSETFSSYDISVGKGGDAGIDNIAIIVNGYLVTEPEEVQDLAEINGYLDIIFIFVQAERSSSFDSAKIGQFGYGVVDFFSETPSLPQNENVKFKSRIANEIFKLSPRFSKGNPYCYLYYITTGTWTYDQQLTVRRDAVVDDLNRLNLFRKVSFDCMGAQQLQQLYRESKNTISTEITFQQKTAFPEIPSVDDAYMGLLPANEFLKLIQNTNEEILTSLFFDNLRDWQEWNPVNSEMKQTLEKDTTKEHFPLLDNGVTIVARRVNPSSNKLLIEDYQIVNGCQTSYVLHDMRESLTERVMIPVRIIATKDETLKNSIIKATNRQTPVTEEQLFALSDFPKRLEAFFPTFQGKQKLYYERRSRQYAAVQGIEKVRVINMTALVRAFASIFLELPHRTTRNYKSLLKNIGTKIFNSTHRLEPYYVSGYAHYKLEFLFRNQSLVADLKPARYHLLLGIRLMTERRKLPPFNSNEMQKYCERMMNTLWDDQRSLQLFQKCAKIVRTVAGKNIIRDNIRTEPFTGQFIDKVENY